MNKKGVVIGTAISTIVTIIAVTFIMVLFVAASLAIAALKKPQIEQSISTVSASNFLFRTTSLTDLDNPDRKLTVLEANADGTLATAEYNQLLREIQTASDGPERESKIDEKNKIANRMSQVKEAIKQFMTEKSAIDTCFIMFQGPGKPVKDTIDLAPNGKDIFLQKDGATVRENNNWMEIMEYHSHNLLVKLPEFTSEKYGESQTFKILIYYGPCKHFTN